MAADESLPQALAIMAAAMRSPARRIEVMYVIGSLPPFDPMSRR
jgi:hypothetical protein